MLPRWMMALLVLLRERWSARRDAQVSFLRLQLEITRSRLPGNRVGNRLLSATEALRCGTPRLTPGRFVANVGLAGC